MKVILLSFTTVVLLLFLSFRYSNKDAYSPSLMPVSAVLCNNTNAEVEALAEFFQTPTYRASLTEPIRVRKNISQLTIDDSIVIALKKGITAMKKKPASDPTSWSYQVNIHGTLENKLLPVWNTCTHKSDFFLSWHRMYLYFFERIMRKASGDSNFALPYWDWSKIEGQSLPKTFRDGKDKNNSLYIPGRDETMNLGGLLAKAVVQNDVVASFKSQYLISKQAGLEPSLNTTLEAIHGKIHIAVGGRNGLMKSIATAAQDPIFWMHHCNIDHLWEKWMVEKNPVLPDDKDPWTTQKFTFFDENGKQVTMSGKDIVFISKQLNYKYEDIPVKTAEYPKTSVINRTLSEPALTVAAAKSVLLSADKNIFTLSPTIPGVPDMQKQFNLVFENIKLKGWADGVFELYVNQSVDSKPDPDNDNYLGSVDFFALTETNPKDKNLKNQIFDVTESIRALIVKNRGFGNLNIMIYHRLPELNGVSKPQSQPVSASVAQVKLVQY